MLNVEFIHSKFLLTWILILFMRIVVFIPFKAQVIAGKAIGRMMHPFMHKLRSTAYSNISHCFPEKKQPQVERLVKRHFGQLESVFLRLPLLIMEVIIKLKNC